MDAPPPNEDCRPFVTVANYLEAMSLNAPRVIAADLDNGFLLLSDLGSTQYLDALTSDAERAPSLYDDAINALVQMQTSGQTHRAMLPPYDAKLLEFELSLFHDWLCEKHVGIEFSVKDELAWRDTCSLLIGNALDQPRVFVHRDYHSRNLMVVNENNPGILDFQDAMNGPIAYDLVSLLKDCYIRWPVGQVRAWAETFYRRNELLHDAMDIETFLRHFDLMGVQRHIKAAGIFARLNHRDGKPGYLGDIPRTLAYVVELLPAYPELGFVVELISDRILPEFAVSA